MKQNARLWILLVSGLSLISFGGILIWVLIVTQPFDLLAEDGSTLSTSDANTFPTTTMQQTPNAIGWSVGNQAPEIQLEDLTGATVRLSDFRGKPVLVNFWATWCIPCRTEMPILEKKYRASKGSKEFVILAVDVKDDSGTSVVQNFLDELSLTFPVLLDKQGLAETTYHVLGLPTSFFIDRRGVIRATRVGAMSEQYLDEQLQKISTEE